MRTPEAYEKAEIDRHLKDIGAYVVKPATYGFGVSGTPDRVCCYEGRFFAIEVKREGKQPTISQWERIEEVKIAGGKAFWGTAKKVIAEIEAWRA